MKTLVSLSLAALLCGCASAPPPATPVSFDSFDVEANNGKQISLEGYLRLPRMGLVTDTMLVDFHPEKDGKGKKALVSMPIGSGRNQMEKPPKDYRQEDLKVHTADGSVVGPNDRVRVSGKLYWSKIPEGHTSFLTQPLQVEKI